MAKPDTDKRLFSVVDAAKYCDIGRTKFYELIHEKKVTSVKIGERRLVNGEALDAFIDSLTAAS